MTAPSVGVERRVGQRFPFLLSVSFREIATGLEGLGFTQDLSSRGAFFLTDAPLRAGAEIELTLKMPSEITLGESMRVRCRGRILRIVRPDGSSTQNSLNKPCAETKIGVAVRLEGYDYLPETEPASGLARVSTLHPSGDKEEPLASR